MRKIHRAPGDEGDPEDEQEEDQMVEKRSRSGGDPDERYVRSRIEDRSPWAKISYYMDIYKPLLWLGSLLLVAAGFGFATPSQKFAALEAQILADRRGGKLALDSLKVRQDASLVDRKDQRQMLEFAIRAQCVGMTEVEIRRLGGVEVCNAAFNPSKHAQELGIYAPGERLR